MNFPVDMLISKL